MSGVELIAAERERQVRVEGWNASHDANHDKGELAIAAACYAIPAGKRKTNTATPARRQSKAPLLWPWAIKWWKPTPDDRIRELVKAGALIAAEIDRLQRIAK